MGATICWKPMETSNETIPGKGIVKSALQKAFGYDLPHVYDVSHIPVLKGMAAVYYEDNNPYEMLIEAIEKHDKIEVWAEY